MSAPVVGERACVLASGLNPNGFRAVTILSTYSIRHCRVLSWEWQQHGVMASEAFGVLLFAGAAALLWARSKARVSDWLLFWPSPPAGIRRGSECHVDGPHRAHRDCELHPLEPDAAGAGGVPGGDPGAGGRRRPDGAGQRLPVSRRASGDTPPGPPISCCAQRLRDGCFNTYDYGGYLIWRLWPHERVFIDGRALNESVSWITGGWPLTPTRPAAKAAKILLDQYGIQVIVMDGFDFASGEPYLLPAALSGSQPKGMEAGLPGCGGRGSSCAIRRRVLSP